METLIRISRGLDALVSGVGKLAAWLALPLVALIIFDVIFRKFGGQGSTKLQEMEWHLHATLFLLCFGYAYFKDAHVRIELARDHMKQRTRAWIEIFGILVFLVPYTAIVFYFGIDFVQRSFATNEVSAALTGLPYRWIIKSMIPASMILLFLAGVAVLLRSVVFLFGPESLHEEAGSHVGAHHELGEVAEKFHD